MPLTFQQIVQPEMLNNTAVELFEYIDILDDIFFNLICYFFKWMYAQNINRNILMIYFRSNIMISRLQKLLKRLQA